MILRHLYQNPINKKYMYKNNYSLTHIFNLSREYLLFFLLIYLTRILIQLTWNRYQQMQCRLKAPLEKREWNRMKRIFL